MTKRGNRTHGIRIGPGNRTRSRSRPGTKRRPARRSKRRLENAAGEGNIGQAYLASLVPSSPDVQLTSFFTMTQDSTPIELRWYTRKNATPGSAVVYVHGGGMILGNLGLYDAIVSAYVTATGSRFFSQLPAGARSTRHHPRRGRICRRDLAHRTGVATGSRYPSHGPHPPLHLVTFTPRSQETMAKLEALGKTEKDFSKVIADLMLILKLCRTAQRDIDEREVAKDKAQLIPELLLNRPHNGRRLAHIGACVVAVLHQGGNGCCTSSAWLRSHLASLRTYPVVATKASSSALFCIGEA